MIYLSLGSNLSSSFGNRIDTLNKGMFLLNNEEIKIKKRSSFYETPSYPDKNNPKFINLVISIVSDLNPVDLMSKLILIEEHLERKRKQKNDPRTCDIDIIDYKSQVLDFKFNDQNLSIPHKEICNRNFVLFPLQEIDPNWKHPKSGEIITSLIKKLSDEDRKHILKIKNN